MVKAKNIYRNTIKLHETMETAQPLNSFWNSVPRHNDMHWLHHRCYMNEHNVCGVISEPPQSSSRRVSSFKDSSALLNNRCELHKSEILLITSTLLVVKAENTPIFCNNIRYIRQISIVSYRHWNAIMYSSFIS